MPQPENAQQTYQNIIEQNRRQTRELINASPARALQEAVAAFGRTPIAAKPEASAQPQPDKKNQLRDTEESFLKYAKEIAGNPRNLDDHRLQRCFKGKGDPGTCGFNDGFVSISGGGVKSVCGEKCGIKSFYALLHSDEEKRAAENQLFTNSSERQRRAHEVERARQMRDFPYLALKIHRSWADQITKQNYTSLNVVFWGQLGSDSTAFSAPCTFFQGAEKNEGVFEILPVGLSVEQIADHCLPTHAFKIDFSSPTWQADFHTRLAEWAGYAKAIIDDRLLDSGPHLPEAVPHLLNAQPGSPIR